jgi:hypothetical protein
MTSWMIQGKSERRGEGKPYELLESPEEAWIISSREASPKVSGLMQTKGG